MHNPLAALVLLAILASSAPGLAAEPWPPLIVRPPAAASRTSDHDGVLDFNDPSQWVADGVRATFDGGVVTLSGAGYLKARAGLLTYDLAAKAHRLLVDYFVEGGPAVDLGLATRGFPQTEGITFPRWATVDISSPVGRWFTCSYDLSLCEWGGGKAGMYEDGTLALSFINTPGGATTAVRMRNPTFVRDAFRIKHDWLAPYEPLTFTRNEAGCLSYRKTFTVESLSQSPVTLEVAVDTSAAAFSPRIAPDRMELAPGQRTTFTFTAVSTPDMPPLAHAPVRVTFREAGRRETAQTREFLIGAPFPSPDQPSTTVPAMPSPAALDAALARELRLPPAPVAWMGQSTLNSYARMEYTAFDTFRDSGTGEVHTGTKYTSGALHRLIFRDISTLAAGFAHTGDRRFAAKVKDWLVLYAREGSKYPIALPISEATSALCPNNATYVQAAVVMGPLMRALNLVWRSDAFSAEDRRTIHHEFILPRILESMKINPGMTNMQDEINNMTFFAGLTIGDPNLIAHALFGSHGLQAKIDLAFTPDGSTEESIASGYHGAVVRAVSGTVDGVLASGLQTGLDFGRLKKAKILQSQLAMPDGQIPNRGDTPAPGGRVADADQLPSMTFDHFGMSILREGRGSNAVYIALDHRPPATTHSHHDKLSIALYGGGRIFGCDEGSLYNIDAGTSSDVGNWSKRAAWGHHSLVHNTITVDGMDQKFGGGHRLYFQGDDADVRAVGAYTDNVYDGVRFERHIALVDGVVILVDRLLSKAPHAYDLAHHSRGDVRVDIPMRPVDALGSEPMYKLPEDVQAGTVPPGTAATVSWSQDGACMHYRLVNIGASDMKLSTATGWANVRYQLVRQEAPFLMARQQGTHATFVSVISFGKTPATTGPVNHDRNRLTVDVPAGEVVFDFAANRVALKP